jgi:hypothetical protein
MDLSGIFTKNVLLSPFSKYMKTTGGFLNYVVEVVGLSRRQVFRHYDCK